MDYLYQQNINTEAVSITNVIILPNKLAGDVYFEQVFEKFVDIVVYTCDDYYPQNIDFKNKVKDEIKNNPKINLIVLGQQSLVELDIATKKIFVLDDLILADFSTNKNDRLQQLNLDPYKIALLIKTFCNTHKKQSLGFNLKNEQNFKKYKPELFNDLYTMISGQNATE
jgi:hypothetical protein